MVKLITIGLILLFLGIILVFIGSFFEAATAQKGKANIKTAGGVFIGPFPLFGWASDKQMFYTLMAVAVIFFLIYTFFLRN